MRANLIARLVSTRFLPLAAAAFLVACSAGPTGSGEGNGNGNGNGTSDAGTTNGDGGSTGWDSGTWGDPPDGGQSCAGEVSTAELVPLDMYIMLDRSGSMNDKTGQRGQGVVKWDAVTTALSDFLADPRSQGIGVGLQYFPITKPDAPATCDRDSDCDASNSGPCVQSICSDGSGVCSSNYPCPQGATCDPLGQCENKPEKLCLPIGAQCPGNEGQCVRVTTSFCLETDSCDAALYAQPDVAIAPLPAVATDITASMTSQSPEGGTPTSAALQGGVDYASSWAVSHPEHTVVVVLATDGEPTACDPLDPTGIGAIAAAAASADPSVLTFVIGVIESNNTAARDALNEIAAAGGVQQAFFVDPATSNVSEQFRDALDAIRGTALACEYFVPQPTPPQVVAFDEVNVEHTPVGATAPVTIPYVGDASNCQTGTGGWYYDVDPSTADPGKIIMCPSTCGDFSAGGTVNIRVGCATIVL